MSSPVRVLEPVTSHSRGRNAKRRILSDSEDAEERDPKRVRPRDVAEDQGGRDTREKKKRCKKRRKVSVVASAPDSDPESPTIATKRTLSRVRSRSTTTFCLDSPTVASPGKPMRENTRQPSAGPSSMPELEPRAEPPLEDRDQFTPPPAAPSTTANAVASVDKGKGRATPEAAIVLNDPQRLSDDLQKQVADKTNLISKHENLVSSLQQSLSCQICLDLMHRPYALAPCGHSACYQCLVNWFKAPPPDIPLDEVVPVLHRKKTCPHCRAVVRDRPIEIWSLKEMVATLVKSGLATSLYNSAPEPSEGSANADPWVGIFRSAGQHVFPDEPYPGAMHQLMGLRDDEDDVYRCIDCNHEIWGSHCSHCHREYPGHHESDFDSSSDSSSDADFPFAHAARAGLRSIFRHLLQPAAAPPQTYAHAHELLDDEDDEPVDRDWDGGGDTEIEVESGDDELGHGARQRATRRTAAQARGLLVDESEDDEAGYESSFIDDGEARPAPDAAGEVDVLDLVDGVLDDGHDRDDGQREDDDEDDSVHMMRASRSLARRRLAFIVSDDEDLHDGDGSDRSQTHDEANEGEDLAEEVAAREFEMYGDDGSIPRGGYDSYDSEDDVY